MSSPTHSFGGSGVTSTSKLALTAGSVNGIGMDPARFVDEQDVNPINAQSAALSITILVITLERLHTDSLTVQQFSCYQEKAPHKQGKHNHLWESFQHLSISTSAVLMLSE